MSNKIIDFQADIFPDNMAKKVLFDLRERVGIKHYSNGTLNGLIESMELPGIDISVL